MSNLLQSAVKEVKLELITEVLKSTLLDSLELIEVQENIENGSHSFEVGQYAFMTEEEAFQSVINSYEGDHYILGCFNSDFLASFVELPENVVKILQKNEAFEDLGKLVIDNDNFEDMIQEYIILDGYGHALNSYDGDYLELVINNKTFIVYRT